MTRFVALALLCLTASVALAQTCVPAEYAQYRDRAASKVGQLELARTGCALQAGFQNAKTRGERSLEIRDSADAARALAEMRACNAEKQKVGDALAAVKATKALEFMADGCAGTPPK